MVEVNASRVETIKKFLMEYRNFPGAMALARNWGLSKEEIYQILQESLREAAEKGILEKKRFDMETMRYLSLEEWLRGKMNEVKGSRRGFASLWRRGLCSEGA